MAQVSNQKVSESFIYCKSHFITGASIYPHILGLLPLNFATLPISVRTLRVKCTFSQYFALGEQRVKTLSWSTGMAFHLVVYGGFIPQETYQSLGIVIPGMIANNDHFQPPGSTSCFFCGQSQSFLVILDYWKIAT